MDVHDNPNDDDVMVMIVTMVMVITCIPQYFEGESTLKCVCRRH